MGFPSPASDYVETRLDLNELFIPHPSATSLIEHNGTRYLVDRAIVPKNGGKVCYELFGEVGLARVSRGCLISEDGNTIEGEVMQDVLIMGCVTLEILSVYDENRPTI
ncbi:hypothetical protein [Erwinia sp. S38]|uniref:hypothetical protein n=1 Tax=Erwinia sp. S38 TaxID=2769338 RepID=UPI00190B1EC4|nr:hypothetical protein [Erwinia sp. S38]MBK0003185.1 hypothetical protein [Erwinia sp. S38]